ncbi:tRNA(Met) cytidine acetyltransferase TmcA [Kaarinaea lacus]
MQNSQPATDEKIACLADQILTQTRERFHRHCIILSGSQPWCHSSVRAIIRHKQINHCLVVANSPLQINHIEQLEISAATQCLGHEFEHAIIDFHDGIDPNALGAISGTVSGGGLMILLFPPLSDLENFKDPEKQRMAIWPHRAQDVGTRFLQRMRNIILDSNYVSLIQENRPLPRNVAVENVTDMSGYLKNDICRTKDQQQVVEAIEHVAHGHRRRPLVITANRGRGKSAALGIAAARLLQQGTPRIIVTGPRLSATAMVFKHAQNLLQSAHSMPGNITLETGCLEFIAPDVLCGEKPPCSLLLIDEAAAIPATILQQLLQHYARIAFATTTYGYEGTGRGFAVKFQDTLNRTTPGWQALQMNTPIRWAPDDPVENFVFRCLCLEAAVVETKFTIDKDTINITKLDRDTLIGNESLLSAIFGLLVLAHYQTQPRDLRYLLDAIGLDIFIAKHNDNVIGTAVLEREGELSAVTAVEVYRNERRVMGHLLPQTLESFAGIQHASQARYARIVRIAVHPDCRRQGIGQRLLQAIDADASQQQVDIIGSTFGASSELLSFWQCAGYSPVHVGLKHNTSTGTNAITYLKPVSVQGGDIYQAAMYRFASRLTFQLGEAYQDLSCDIVAEIFKQIAGKTKLQLIKAEWDDITSFATASRGYEINALSIYKLIAYLFETGQIDNVCNIDEQCLLIKKVLQRQPWQTLIVDMNLKGRKEATRYLRQTLAKIINNSSFITKIQPSEIQ